jgi:osmotically-inducible protein OsmY
MLWKWEGIVALEGQVEWPHQKDAAEAALEHLLGVRGILNEITVKPAVSPTEVKRKIVAALELLCHKILEFPRK